MKSYLSLLAILAGVLFIQSCKGKDDGLPTLDFRPVEAENVITPPAGIARVEVPFNGYSISCGEEVVFTISNINAAIGVLTLASFKDPEAANCDIVSEITRIAAVEEGKTTTKRFNPIRRTLRPGPGGAFTEIMETAGVASINVRIRCSGSPGGKCVFDLKFETIKDADKNNPPPAGGGIDGDSNPDGGRTHAPIGGAAGANPCTTQEILLNTIYVDLKKARPLLVSIKSKSLCDCDSFIVNVVTSGGNALSKATRNGSEGPTQIVPIGKRGEIRIFGRCNGQVEPHQCKGDALFTITEGKVE